MGLRGSPRRSPACSPSSRARGARAGAGAGGAEARADPSRERRGRAARGRGLGEARPAEDRACAARTSPCSRTGSRSRSSSSRRSLARRPGSPAGASPLPAAAASEEEETGASPARALRRARDRRRPHGVREPLRVRKALERFLEEDLRPEDQVALVTTSGASALSQEFTSDRAVLRQVALPALRAGPPPRVERRSLHQRVPGRADRDRRPDGARRGGAGGPAGGALPGRELGRGDLAAQGPRDPHRGRLQLAADPGGAREPVPRPLGPHAAARRSSSCRTAS